MTHERALTTSSRYPRNAPRPPSSAAIAARSSAATSIATCLPSPTTSRPQHDHRPDVGRARGEDDRLERVRLAPLPASRTESSPTVTRSAIAPGSIRPASGQPMRAVAPLGRGAAAAAAAPWWPRSPVTSRSSSSIARISSKRSMTACESEPSARRAPAVGDRRRRPDAVGEVALGRRAEAAGAAALAEQPEVVVGEVGEVDRGEALVRARPASASSVGRADAVRRAGRPRSRPAARRRGREAAARRSRAQRRHRGGRVGIDGADAVDRGADPRARAQVAELLHALGPGARASPSEKRRCAARAARRCRRAGSRRRSA